MRFLADTDIGPVPVVITEVDGDEVVVDGNHMLAGQELHFTVEVVGTREATLEENCSRSRTWCTRSPPSSR